MNESHSVKLNLEFSVLVFKNICHRHVTMLHGESKVGPYQLISVTLQGKSANDSSDQALSSPRNVNENTRAVML